MIIPDSINTYQEQYEEWVNSHCPRDCPYYMDGNDCKADICIIEVINKKMEVKKMAQYRIFADYYFTKDCGVVEANSEEEAIEKAYDERMIENDHTLCWHCEQEMLDHPMLDEDRVTAELEE